MMKRLLMVAAALVAVLAIALVFLSALVTSDAARARVEAELARWLDAKVRIGRPLRLVVGAGPVLALDELSVDATPAGWSLRDARLEADLALAPLLFGEVRLSAITISGGHILLPPNKGGGLSVSAVTAAFAGEVRRLLEHPLRVDGASLSLSGTGGGDETVLARDLSFQLSASSDGALSLRGAMTAADQSLQWTAALSNRSVLFEPAKGAFAATLASPLATLRLDGELLRADTAWFRGDIEFMTSDLRGLAVRFGHTLAGEAAFGAARVAGSGEISATALSLAQADIEFDGNAGDGRLAVDLAGPRPRLEATLAFDTLDLSAYLAEAAPAPGGGAGWMRQPLAGLLGTADIDLRLSAGRLVAGTRALDATAVSMLLREGDMTLDVGGTMAGGGDLDLSARLRPDPEAGGLRSAVTLMVDAMRVEDIPLPEGWPRPTAGTLSGRVAWTGRGEEVADLLAGADGEATLTASGLRFALGGADSLFASLLGTGVAADATAPSHFERTVVALKGGLDGLEIVSLEAETQRHQLTAAGRISFPRTTLSLRGLLAPRAATQQHPSGDPGTPGSAVVPGGSGKTAARRDVGAPALPVLVRGTLSEPLVVPDLTKVDGSQTR